MKLRDRRTESARADVHRDRWMVSYLDVVTLLLLFFVAAAAKTLAPRESAPPPVATPAPVVSLPAVIHEPVNDTVNDTGPPPDVIRHQLEMAGFEVRREPRGLVVGLPQAILFSPGDDHIGSGALPMLEQVAGILRSVPNQVILVGHADSVPIHNRRFKNNWELSVARGMRLLELLSTRYQLEDSRLSVSGDGSNLPKDTNDTPEGRASNRRVELVVLDEPAGPR